MLSSPFQPLEFLHFKSRADLRHLVLVLLLVFGIGLGVYLSLQPQIFNKKAAEDSVIDIGFSPEILNIRSGVIYETKIVINPKSQRVTASKLHIKYDPEVFSILETINSGFLPVTLKTQDSHTGELTLIFASTIDFDSSKPGTLATIKLKALNPKTSSLEILSDSEINISSREENVLISYPMLVVEPAEPQASQEPARYPDNLLLEKAFFASSEPVIRDFRESLETKSEIKSDRIDPEFSMAFVKQLGTDIFISPIVALNEVIEEKVGEAFGK